MLVLPVAAEFRPDLILVSAGFDAADKDPLGELQDTHVLHSHS
jgi:histone deacetylase 6